MAHTVRVKSGSFNGMPVEDMVFPLLTPFTKVGRGGYISVDGTIPFNRKRCRIQLDGAHMIEYTNEEAPTMTETVVTKTKTKETDEQIIERIAERFEILEDMTTAVKEGDVRAMIVVGPPGVGKSYGVERIVEKACLFDMVSGKRLRAEVVKGSASAIGLYTTLYKYSDTNCVLVFDDCDSILVDDVALNLLKGALDSGKKRKISWLSESSTLRREGIPDQFEFNGSVIFITNLKFDSFKSQKLKDHLDALQSRCHYLDLTLDTMRDKILRIKQIAKTGELFADMDISPAGQDEIIEFMDEKKDRLREMSLRMAIKVAQLYKSFPNNWKAMTETTCMR